MIRCVRLWTGQDGNSHVLDGWLDMADGRNNDLVSSNMAASHVTVEETAGGGSMAPRRRRPVATDVRRSRTSSHRLVRRDGRSVTGDDVCLVHLDRILRTRQE